MSDRPPPMADECPAVEFDVEVHRHGDFLTVDARLLHRMPDGSLKHGWVPFDGGSIYVHEPCWLFRLFGDTTERRVNRAIDRVRRRARREIARRRRLETVIERLS